MRLRFGPAEAIGAAVGAVLGTLALAFTGPLALGGLLAGFVLGWAIVWGVGWICGRLLAAGADPIAAPMNPTKDKLLAAAAESLRADGIAGLSARVIADRAGVNQALIFYHFGTVRELLDAAVREAADASADFYRDQLAAVASLSELLALGRELHRRERDLGNVAMMAQLMSGAQQDQTLAAAAGYALGRWSAEIEQVVRRVLGNGPLAGLTDLDGLARAISAGFIGLELYEGVDPAGAGRALDALEQLGLLVDVLDDLGPIARRALDAKVRRTRSPANTS